MTPEEQYNASISPFVRDMESVFTIDGRGRPRKCKLFLELIEKHGLDAVLAEIKNIANSPERHDKWVWKGGGLMQNIMSR